jgi:hypothetical protein
MSVAAKTWNSVCRCVSPCLKHHRVPRRHRLPHHFRLSPDWKRWTRAGVGKQSLIGGLLALLVIAQIVLFVSWRTDVDDPKTGRKLLLVRQRPQHLSLRDSEREPFPGSSFQEKDYFLSSVPATLSRPLTNRAMLAFEMLSGGAWSPWGLQFHSSEVLTGSRFRLQSLYSAIIPFNRHSAWAPIDERELSLFTAEVTPVGDILHDGGETGKLEYNFTNANIAFGDSGELSSSSIHLGGLFEQYKSHVVFYNIRVMPHTIPLDATYPSSSWHSIFTVEQQLEQLAASYATGGDKKLIVYYNTIGSLPMLDHAALKQQCVDRNMDCIHLKNFPSDEDSGSAVGLDPWTMSMQQVFEFCHREEVVAFDDDNDFDSSSNEVHHPVQVIYMHNRLTGRSFDESLRPALTYAVTSRECLHESTLSRSCNVCGLQFFHESGYLFAGDMWTSKCSYIRTLVPPVEYEEKSRGVLNHLLPDLIHNDVWDSSLSEQNMASIQSLSEKAAVTVSRYTWISSHPRFVPCDLEPNRSLEVWFDAPYRRPHWRPRLSPSPREAYSPKVSDIAETRTADGFNIWRWLKATVEAFLSRHKTLDNKSPDRKSELKFILNHLLQWEALYDGSYPPEASWVWRIIRNGSQWYNDIHATGLHSVINSRLSKFSLSDLIDHFSSEL